MIERSCWIYRHALPVALVAALLFVAVALLMSAGLTMGIDLYAKGLADSWRSDHFVQAADLVTTLGTAPYQVAVAIIAWLLVARQGRRSETYLPLLPLAAESLTNPMIKAIFHRPRPTEPWPPGIFGVDQYSFPSGHAMSTTALYSLLVFWAWSYPPARFRVPLAVLVALIPIAVGLSRVALNAHWLSDVVGGWLAGVAVMAIVVEVWVILRRGNAT